MMTEIIINIFKNSWPMILILTTILASMRITYYIKNKERFVFYHEMLQLGFLIYILCLFYVVTFQDVSWSTSNFIPFKEMFRYDFGSRLFIKNVLGNIVLFAPYGFFVGYFLRLKKFKSALFMILIASVSIEVTQLLIGRVFDIDDIILNIIGGLIGFAIFKSMNNIKKHLPNVLKRPIFYNIIVIIVIVLGAMYMLNLIELGV